MNFVEDGVHDQGHAVDDVHHLGEEDHLQLKAVDAVVHHDGHDGVPVHVHGRDHELHDDRQAVGTVDRHDVVDGDGWVHVHDQAHALHDDIRHAYQAVGHTVGLGI